MFAQSPDRIFVLQRGETTLPEPPPSLYTNFAGSLGWNVVRDPQHRVWRNCIYVINSEGAVLEVWDHWDHLFTATEGPGPHRIRISPYDPEQRVWVVDETGNIIYVFSEALLDSDGSKSLIAWFKIPAHMKPSHSNNPFPAVGTSGTRTHKESIIFD